MVVEVHNTYGGRHAYLVHPDEQGRARVDKALYVSPFHGTDGWYDVAVPVPGDDLHVAITLHTDDGARVQRLACRRRVVPRPRRWRAPPGRPARCRPDPRPRHRALAADSVSPAPPSTQDDRTMTTSLSRPSLDLWPDLARTPSGLAHDGLRRRRPPRSSWPAVRRLPVTVHAGAARILGTGGPSMTVHRPGGVLRAGSAAAC